MTPTNTLTNSISIAGTIRSPQNEQISHNSSHPGAHVTTPPSSEQPGNSSPPAGSHYSPSSGTSPCPPRSSGRPYASSPLLLPTASSTALLPAATPPFRSLSHTRSTSNTLHAPTSSYSTRRLYRSRCSRRIDSTLPFCAPGVRRSRSLTCCSSFFVIAVASSSRSSSACRSFSLVMYLL